MISYDKDPLLKSNSKNIYACLVRQKDLKDKNFGLRTPIVEIANREKIINLVKEKYGNLDTGFLFFIRELEKYMGIKYASLYKTKYRYLQLFKKNKANILFLRVISLSLNKDKDFLEDFIIKNDYIKINRLRLPVSNLNKTISYLAGVIVGDGHLDKNEKEIVIADGQSDKNKLELSKKYIEYIDRLFKREFTINGKIKYYKTWIRYRIDSKWLSRFFDYYFEIPPGNKSHIVKFPKISSGLNEGFFWRGLMDTDGYVREGLKQITLRSSSIILLNQFKKFCKKNNIITKVSKEKNGFDLRILAASFLNYSNLVGFSHPRKKEALLKHLQEGPKYNIIKNISNPLFKFLRPYRENVYISFSDNNQKTDKKKVKRIINKIADTFNVKITRIKRNRYNDHYYICSREFTRFIRSNTTYELPWQSLNKNEINRLSKKMIL